MRKFYVILSFLFSVFFFSQEFKWGMTGNVHSSSIEGIHDFSRGRIAPSLGFFAEIPLETFQRSIYSPLRYYIFPVLEYSMEGEKTILEQGRQYYRRRSDEATGCRNSCRKNWAAGRIWCCCGIFSLTGCSIYQWH